MTIAPLQASQPLETDHRHLAEAGRHLLEGGIVILRGLPAINVFRTGFEARATAAGAVEPALRAFFQTGESPDLPTLHGIATAMKSVRRERFLSVCLAPIAAGLGLPAPVRLDGGIPRLVLPAETIEAARASGLFEAGDFARASADGPTEIFMARPANLHRDYDRPHDLFQANLWFPLHDCGEDGVLRLYPDAYRGDVHDMDATAENLAGLGPPLRYRLGFGDAVLFHGEHLHTSPAAGVGRRLSYDFRIAADCTDDTAHYRQGFLDLRNFLGEPSALESLLAIEDLSYPTPARFGALLDRFDRLPFAEDRYLIAARRAVPVAPALALRPLRTISERSPHWFWVFQAGTVMLEAGLHEPARAALSRARALAAEASAKPGHAPVSYTKPRTQPDAGTTARICEEMLTRLG